MYKPLFFTKPICKSVKDKSLFGRLGISLRSFLSNATSRGSGFLSASEASTAEFNLNRISKAVNSATLLS